MSYVCPRRGLDLHLGLIAHSTQFRLLLSPKVSFLVHTDGIAAWPLNLLRTRLSIPLGFLQFGSTHLNLSCTMVSL